MVPLPHGWWMVPGLILGALMWAGIGWLVLG